jgi:lipopolysaccharide export system permease protein
MLIQILLLSIVVPKSQEIARSQLRSSDIDFFEGLIKPKKFNDTIKGLTVYAEEKNINEEFKNIYIKKNSSNNGFQITFAKKGVFELKGNKKILVLYDGQTLNNNGTNITNFDFSKSDFGLSNTESHLVTHQKIKEQTTITLLNCLQTFFNIRDNNILNCNKNNSRETYKELFKRLVSPFYLPVLTLISLLLILTSKENIRYIKNKYITFLIGFGIIIISESSLGYITNDLIKNISISIFPLILIIITYLIFVHQLDLFNRKTS